MQFSPDALKAGEWTEENIKKQSLGFLRELKGYEALELKDKDFLSRPRKSERSAQRIRWKNNKEKRSKQILQGHRCRHNPSGPYARTFQEENRQGLMVNPGSVGQLRDGDRRARYVLLNVGEDQATIHRVPYDIDRISEKIRGTELPNGLAERLYDGNQDI